MPSFNRVGAARLSLWLPLIAYMAAIFYVSGLQIAPLPEEVSDKTGHLVAYGGLGVLSLRAVAGGLTTRVTWRVVLLALAIAGGYGIFDEVHQMFVPGRSADIADWFADMTGVVIGIGACWLWGIIAFRSDGRRRV
ncbi:MAG TPA: VanZ family protein [Vicinamibacterales bacterium]|nr:VanZ family protein [Vicinamibacterales bacterium]